MSSHESRGNNIPVFGLLLLFLGVVFLLQTLGALPWGLWWKLWRFWPVLLINAGIAVLLRHRNPWLVGLVILVLLFASLGIAYWQYVYAPPGTVDWPFGKAWW